MDAADRSFTLALDGHEAVLKLIHAETGSYRLSVDGIPQSIVSTSHPELLDWPYVRQIGRLLDAAAPAGAPLRCLHLGAGALTLPRYVEHSRPGSPQVVVEYERELGEAVLAALPLPPRHGVRMLYGDARELAERAAPAELGAPVEFAVIDLWEASTVRARVASREFYALVSRLLAPGAVVAVNLLDGARFEYARRQAATLAAVFRHVAVVLAESPTSDGSDPLDNVLVVASDEPLVVVAQPELFAEAGEGPGEPPFVLHGGALESWVGSVPEMTDATATDSPSPDDPRFGGD
ncbi:spermidine synthase [Herbiconiux sp. A18JL235]|uniref:Spermidine synthase n=1 Tax=Herbiconiux sp. A18JL235 TaxID=3152363 RepID=A0AB39BE54_9MICO